jgi:predicted dehydrogenase
MNTMEKKIWKVAVVGCGSFANGQYLPNISKEANAECIAAVDIVIERAIAACEKYNIPHYYETVHELLEKCPEVEIIIDAASIQAHHEINMAALTHGKHLISQKPAAPTVEMMTLQIETAKKMGVQFVCAPIHNMRFDLNIIKRMMQDGTIGRPYYAKSNMSHGGPEYFQYRDADPSWFFDEGAGALVDMGVHGLQIVTSLFGPAKAFACMAKVTTPIREVRSGSYDGKKIIVFVTNIATEDCEYSLSFSASEYGIDTEHLPSGFVLDGDRVTYNGTIPAVHCLAAEFLCR